MNPAQWAGIIFGLLDRFLPDDTKADWMQVQDLYGELLVGLDPLILEAVEAKWQSRMESRAADTRLWENSDLDEARRQDWLLRQKGETL